MAFISDATVLPQRVKKSATKGCMGECDGIHLKIIIVDKSIPCLLNTSRRIDQCANRDDLSIQDIERLVYAPIHVKQDLERR